jgi:hypothetical protein
MDEIRGSFSSLKKKVKRRLAGRKRESGRTGAGARGESVDPAGPPPQAEPPVVAGGHHDGDGNGANADGQQVHSTDRPQQPDEPESVPAHGSENDQERGEGDVDERVVRYSHPRPDAEMTVESGRGRDGKDPDGKKVEQAYPSLSTASIPHSGTPDRMWACYFGCCL